MNITNSNSPQTLTLTDLSSTYVKLKIQADKEEGRQIWLYFGLSANPIHNGHVSYLEKIVEALEPERVTVIPAKVNPFKAGSFQLTAKEKKDTVEAALSFHEDWIVDTQELDRDPNTPSYTWKTIQNVYEKAITENASIYLLLSDETAQSFHRWTKPDFIIERVTLVYGNRPGNLFDKEQFITSLKTQIPPIDEEVINALANGYIPISGDIIVSSTEIRNRLAEGLPIDHLVGSQVAKILVNTFHNATNNLTTEEKKG